MRGKIIKVALSSSHSCGLEIPEFLANLIHKDTMNLRVVLANLLDSLECNAMDSSTYSEDEEKLLKGEIKYIKYIKYPNIVYFKKSLGGYDDFVVSITLEEVDTSKPWRVLNYDGIEYIDVFKGIDVVDVTFNECRW